MGSQPLSLLSLRECIDAINSQAAAIAGLTEAVQQLSDCLSAQKEKQPIHSESSSSRAHKHGSTEHGIQGHAENQTSMAIYLLEIQSGF